MTTTELETWSTRPETTSLCRKRVEFGEDHHKHMSLIFLIYLMFLYTHIYTHIDMFILAISHVIFI